MVELQIVPLQCLGPRNLSVTPVDADLNMPYRKPKTTCFTRHGPRQAPVCQGLRFRNMLHEELKDAAHDITWCLCRAVCQVWLA